MPRAHNKIAGRTLPEDESTGLSPSLSIKHLLAITVFAFDKVLLLSIRLYAFFTMIVSISLQIQKDSNTQLS